MSHIPQNSRRRNINNLKDAPWSHYRLRGMNKTRHVEEWVYYLLNLQKVHAEVKSFNDRILTATFNGNNSTTIIVYYSPQESTDDAIEHYKHLINVMRNLPKHTVLIVMGDFQCSHQKWRCTIHIPWKIKQ